MWIRKSGAAGAASIFFNRRLQRRSHVRVRRLVEADVAVADLHKGEIRLAPTAWSARRTRAKSARRRQTSRPARCQPMPCTSGIRAGRCRPRSRASTGALLHPFVLQCRFSSSSPRNSASGSLFRSLKITERAPIYSTSLEKFLNSRCHPNAKRSASHALPASEHRAAHRLAAPAPLCRV